MFDIVLLAPLIVLFVNVSVVALPTKVSVDVGKVKVPEFEIVEITGLVKVLFVNVSVVFVPTRVVVASGKDMTLSAVGFANVITVSYSSGLEPSKVIPPPYLTSGLPDDIEEEGVTTGVYLNWYADVI